MLEQPLEVSKILWVRCFCNKKDEHSTLVQLVSHGQADDDEVCIRVDCWGFRGRYGVADPD
jgi:hypothetical protein